MVCYLQGAQNQATLALSTFQAAAQGPKVRHRPMKEHLRFKTQTSQFLDARTSTLAITSFSERLLDISLATSIGLVSQLVPLRSAPSGNVIVISRRGCSSFYELYFNMEEQNSKPCTKASYSALSSSKILTRWSKKSGGGWS
jgi:hypothetical protein